MNIYNLAARVKEYYKIINGSLAIEAVFAVYWIAENVFYGIKVQHSDMIILLSVVITYTVAVCLYTMNKAYKNNENILIHIIGLVCSLWVASITAYFVHYLLYVNASN